jgi:hypothetical protein
MNQTGFHPPRFVGAPEDPRSDDCRHFLATLAGARAAVRYRAEDVVRVLEEVRPQIGCPTSIRVDRGTEFVARKLDLWAYRRLVTIDFSRPGKPIDNACVDSFNGRSPAECLNVHRFLTPAESAKKPEDWRRYYTEERPHGAIGTKVSISSVKSDGAAGPPLCRSRKIPPSGGAENGCGARRLPKQPPPISSGINNPDSRGRTDR